MWRSYSAKRHTCMSVTRCKACSGQIGVSVRVAIEKRETLTLEIDQCLKKTTFQCATCKYEELKHVMARHEINMNPTITINLENFELMAKPSYNNSSDNLIGHKPYS